MNQLDVLKNKQAITAARKKMGVLTRQMIKNTSEQQKDMQKNDNRDQRMDMRSNVKQQKKNLVHDRQIWQMTKKRARFNRQMREKIEMEM